jgi:co-chaperonin GroES (HSP10)
MDPRKLRPRDGWVVVLADARKQVLASGIVLPNHEVGAEKMCEGAGELIRCGVGPKNSKMGLENGQRVAFRGFLKYANPIPHEEKWEDGQDKQYFVMSSEDLLAIIPPGMEVGIFSGRPQVPEKK